LLRVTPACPACSGHHAASPSARQQDQRKRRAYPSR
jgi:hypothetical protein